MHMYCVIIWVWYIVGVIFGRLSFVEANNVFLGSSFYLHGLILILAWISNYIHYNAWDEIIYSFPNFNGAPVDIWEWISNFIPHFTEHVITYPCWD